MVTQYILLLFINLCYHNYIYLSTVKKMNLMNLSSYYYDLPTELIAQSPLQDRSASRLLAYSRGEDKLTHDVFSNIGSYLKAGDCLVINDTKVIPARLWAVSNRNAGDIEVVLLSQQAGDGVVWKCLTRPGKKTKPGTVLTFGNGLLTGTVVDVAEEGTRLIEFKCNGPFLETVEQIGIMPLPPYITKRLEDKDRYQTVYAREKGSAAAPTAGLHFTPELLASLQEKGVLVERVLLHVGLGTFRPVKEQDLRNHKMHSEYIRVTEDTANRINAAKAAGGRVIAVGTTSCRTLESAADENGILHPYDGDTDIFLYPGKRFKITDALITNFHLPESTLIMLVSAFAGYENTMRLYKTAVEERYRFFSFGDAMFIC